MKQFRYFLTISYCLFIYLLPVKAQDSSAGDSTGLPGDNFSLQGALEMFKKSTSIEEFEKLINTEGNSVNNLDLNDDGDIDYIRVIDKSENEMHAFILQAIVSATESQDIAVIELEKTGPGTAILQIIGDEDIYGEKTIVEPGNGDEDDNGFINNINNSTAGPNFNFPADEHNYGGVVNVWLWPSVKFVYAPVYRPWVSPWRWRTYPVSWHSWHPRPWLVFNPLRLQYHRGYAVVHTHRVLRVHRIYTGVRVTSVSVRNRNNVRVTHYRTTRVTTIRTGRGKGKVRTSGRRG